MERSEILNIDQLYIVDCFVNSIKSVFYLVFLFVVFEKWDKNNIN